MIKSFEDMGTEDVFSHGRDALTAYVAGHHGPVQPAQGLPAHQAAD